MIPIQPFIPLYFGDEDRDLWTLLAEVPAERRSTYVKEVLRDYLFNGWNESRELVRGGSEPGSDPLRIAALESVMANNGANRQSPGMTQACAGVAEVEPDNVGTPSETELATGTMADTEFTLEALLVSSVPGPVEDNADGRALIGSSRVVGSDIDPGAVVQHDALGFLLHKVIGAEEDPEVIAAIQHSGNSRSQEEGDGPNHRRRDPGAAGPDGKEQVLSLEELQVGSVSCRGLDHLLHNIIGEEDDQEVVAFLKQHSLR